jgi:hypothetical protein
MDRELKLSEKEQRMKEVSMGDVPLDIKGCFEPQGVVDGANLSALTGPSVLRGHTDAVTALAIHPNGDITSLQTCCAQSIGSLYLSDAPARQIPQLYEHNSVLQVTSAPLLYL